MKIFIFQLTLMCFAFYAKAEYALIALGVNKTMDKQITVSIFSEVAAERRKKITTAEACRILKGMTSEDGSYGVAIHLGSNIFLKDYLPLLQAIDKNVWLDLTLLNNNEPKHNRLLKKFRGPLKAPLSAILSSKGLSHTSPAKWKKPRNYHTQEEAMVDIEWVDFKEELKEIDKSYSPNDGYWCYLKKNNLNKEGLETNLYIHTEQMKTLMIKFRKTYPNFKQKTKWINEKLLYVRTYYGRIAGIDIVIDVEQSKVIFSETFLDGTIAFGQFQEAKENKNNADVIVVDTKGVAIKGAKVTPISLSINYNAIETNKRGEVTLNVNVQKVKWIAVTKEGYLPTKHLNFSQKQKPLVVTLIKK